MKSAHGTLVANTVATVPLAEAGANYVTVHFVSGTGPIYFTVDGSTPTVGGADTYIVHTKSPVQPVQIDTADAQSIKLKSATADVYSVIAEAR